MIIFREAGIKLFARISRISKSWKLPVSLPEGAIPHPNRMYSRYMAVWENPDNLGSAINRFKVIKGTYFRLDMKDRDDYISRNIESSINLTRNLDLAVEDIYNNFVFYDNDSRWRNKEYDFDTGTHLLGKLCDSDKLVVCKCLGNESSKLYDYDRLVYEVYKPKKDEKGWYCDVILNNFLGHKYNGKEYLRTNVYSDIT